MRKKHRLRLANRIAEYGYQGYNYATAAKEAKKRGLTGQRARDFINGCLRAALTLNLALGSTRQASKYGRGRVTRRFGRLM